MGGRWRPPCPELSAMEAFPAVMRACCRVICLERGWGTAERPADSRVSEQEGNGGARGNFRPSYATRSVLLLFF